MKPQLHVASAQTKPLAKVWLCVRRCSRSLQTASRHLKAAGRGHEHICNEGCTTSK